MALVLAREIEQPRPCSYLPEQQASLEHVVAQDVSAQELEALLERGWRRFGPVYFRPVCRGCKECVSLRIPTASFRPNRSQRRARAASAHWRVEVGAPRVDGQRLALYRAWHAEREEHRDWEPSPLDARSYHLQFSFPHPSAREVTYWDGTQLVGVGLCDETPRAWSAIYFFYAPAYARSSPGTTNVLVQVELARARGIPYVYLGYRVRGCASLRYKAAFRPHELLESRPGPGEAAEWRQARPDEQGLLP
jgi:arginyl-tRNA--protein-N-Asp/Glu arginylyltransferase